MHPVMETKKLNKIKNKKVTATSYFTIRTLIFKTVNLYLLIFTLSYNKGCTINQNKSEIVIIPL